MTAVQIVVGGRTYALPSRGEVRWDHSAPCAWLRTGNTFLVLTPAGGIPVEQEAGVLLSEQWALL